MHAFARRNAYELIEIVIERNLTECAAIRNERMMRSY
jgi:hypothetical protein